MDGPLQSFFVDQKYTKDTRDPKMSKKVCPYIYIYGYALYIVREE